MSRNRTKPAKTSRPWLTRWADRLVARIYVQEPYWFIHNAGGEGGTFCFDCGEERRKELLRKFSHDPETAPLLSRLDGGRAMECDSCEHCDKCGILLAYSLTNCGAESEWDHFLENGIHLASPEVAYHVQAILEHGMKLAGISKVRLIGREPRQTIKAGSK
jgi:hypothetical protein